MCTKTIQNETAKRRAIQDELRPLAKAAFAMGSGDAEVAAEAHALVERLGIRSCCITFPGEAHGSQGHPCVLR